MISTCRILSPSVCIAAAGSAAVAASVFITSLRVISMPPLCTRLITRRRPHRVHAPLQRSRGVGVEIEHDDLIVRDLQPNRRTIERLLGTHAPVAAEIVAVHPPVALAPAAQVDEQIG